MSVKSIYLLLLTIISVWSYRDLQYGAFYDDLHDYQQFMRERSHVGSDGDFFWQVISFDRVRDSSSQVNFLFRPGLFAFLAWQDIFHRDDLRLSGIISMTLHGLCVIALFLLLSRVVSPILSFLLVLPFTFYANGSLMILWRMIAPYTIALLLYVAGVSLLFWKASSDRLRYVAGLLFFISSLFHECAAFVLALVAVAAWCFHARKKQSPSYWFALFFPPIAYFSLSLLDLCLRAPEGGLFSHYFDRVGTIGSYSAFFPFLVIVRVFQVIGFYLSAFLLPQSVNFPWSISQPFSFVVGAIALWLVFYFGRRHVAALKEGQANVWRWILLLAYPIVLLTMLAIFRVAPLGYFYIGASSYYCYTVAFFLLLVIGSGMKPLMTYRGHFFRVFVGLIYLNIVVFGYQRLRKIIAVDVAKQKSQFETVERVKSKMKPGDCIAWTSEVPLYLYRRSCPVTPGTPVSYSVLAVP